MTRKPRSTYPDRTRAVRSARRQAILDAAAQRMGFLSWSAFEASARAALEGAATDHGAAMRLRSLLAMASAEIIDGPDNLPPADVLAVYERFPLLNNKGQPTRTDPTPATPESDPATPPDF